MIGNTIPFLQDYAARSPAAFGISIWAARARSVVDDVKVPRGGDKFASPRGTPFC
jgi:hypothetical protein